MPDIGELKPVETLFAAEAEKEGDHLLAENQQQKALEYFQHALKLYQEQASEKDISRIHFKIGNLYTSVRDVENALTNLFEGLDISKSVKDDKEIINFHIAIASFYQSLHQFASANEHYIHALKTGTAINDIKTIQECCYKIGNCFNWMNELDKAHEYLTRALSFETIDDNLKKQVFASTGILLYKREDYDLSLNYFSEGLKLNEKNNDDKLKSSILKSMGYVYHLIKDVTKALKCLDEALSISEKAGYDSITYIIHNTYANIYYDIQDYKNAYEHLKKTHHYKELFTNENVRLKTREIQKRFDISESQREKEIYRLKNIDLADANKKISLQKLELEDKNRNITDSIFYAGRLQKAILPPDHLLSKFFIEAFIYFQPKDIVSGDFYWFSGKNERFILAAVDCTGHGVPGALMSMMGNNFLSSIVNTEGRTDPAEILQEMNRRTKTSLQNKEASVTANDGMDIALCSIDFKNEKLYYAGAFRSLIYIRDGKLNEIKADKKSIGGFADFDATFALHEIDIQKGDTFYIYTDGYADQFGGEKNRKYMAGRFKDFLLEISAKNMHEQQQLLSENHFTWRGKNEQVDDLLVIGFRF